MIMHGMNNIKSLHMFGATKENHEKPVGIAGV
jgi:hypothetical protein